MFTLKGCVNGTGFNQETCGFQASEEVNNQGVCTNKQMVCTERKYCKQAHLHWAINRGQSEFRSRFGNPRGGFRFPPCQEPDQKRRGWSVRTKPKKNSPWALHIRQTRLRTYLTISDASSISKYMGVSINGGNPKSAIFNDNLFNYKPSSSWGTPIGNPYIEVSQLWWPSWRSSKLSSMWQGSTMNFATFKMLGPYIILNHPRSSLIILNHPEIYKSIQTIVTIEHQSLVGGLEHQFYFPIYWVSN